MKLRVTGNDSSDRHYQLPGPKKLTSSTAAWHLLELREQDTAQITRSEGK